MHIDVKMFRIKVCSYFFFGLFLNRNKTNFSFLCSTTGVRKKKKKANVLFRLINTIFISFRFSVRCALVHSKLVKDFMAQGSLSCISLKIILWRLVYYSCQLFSRWIFVLKLNELFLELLQRSEVLLSYDLKVFLKRPVPGVQLVKRSVVVNGVISERGVKNRERLGSGRDPAQASLVLRSVLTL